MAYPVVTIGALGDAVAPAAPAPLVPAVTICPPPPSPHWHVLAFALGMIAGYAFASGRRAR